MQQSMKAAGYAAIAGVVLALVSGLSFMISSLSTGAGRYVITFLTVIASLIVLNGFRVLAKRIKNSFLEVMVYVMAALTVLTPWFTVRGGIGIMMMIMTGTLIVTGIVNILFGVGVLKLKPLAGGLAKGLGVVYIVQGAFFVLFLLVFLTPLTALAIGIMEAVMFLRLAKEPAKIIAPRSVKQTA